MQQRDVGNGVCIVTWLLGFVDGRSSLVHTTCEWWKCECVYLASRDSIIMHDSFYLCMPCRLCVSVCVSVCVRARLDVSGARCQYSWLPFLFSSCYHHDNLPTRAQPHTANISFPSPPTCRASSPHPPVYSLSPPLSHFMLSTMSAVSYISISCSLLFPHLCLSLVPLLRLHTMYLKEFPLPVIFAEKLSFICTAPLFDSCSLFSVPHWFPFTL